MDFVNPTHEQCYERVAGWIRELYGEDAARSQADPTFTLSRGSAEIEIAVTAAKGRPLVAVYSWLGSEVSPTEELLRYLLQKNYELLFAALAYHPEEGVLLRQALDSDVLSKEHLRESITEMVRVADDLDDELVARFGGKRARDRVQDPPPSS